MIELNKIYCIDNLELMKQVEDNSLNLIYSDILYNTGNTFKTKDNQIAYIDKIGNTEDVNNFYEPRFKEMKRILKDTGTILIQCYYRLSPYIQILLNKYFVFQDKIIWKKTETGKGAKSLKALSKDYDEIFYYTKTNKFTVNKIIKPHNVVSLKEFKYYDKDVKKYFKIVPLGMYSKISVDKMRENNEIYTTRTGKDYKKYFLTDMNETCLSNIWVDCHNLYNGENKEMNNYPTQKPKSLLERIVYMFSNEGDLVADFFCGSGTTLVIAKELDRQYIGCDISEMVIKISEERLNNNNTIYKNNKE